MLMSVISLALVLCLMMPSVCASAAETQTSYDSVMDYVTDAQSNDETDSKIRFGRFVNGLSNFVINDFLGNVLKMIIPDSAAVADYEKFNIDEYDNFYEGTKNFIDEPQGEKVWSLGYGKASVLPSDFGEKQYAKGAYIPYIFGNDMYTDEDGNKEDLMVRAVVMNDGSGRGNVLFIALDAMGFANADVRQVREGLKDLAKKTISSASTFPALIFTRASIRRVCGPTPSAVF